MKRIWLVALSGALATATMALAMDEASAARRGGGYSRGGVHAGGINRGGMRAANINRRAVAVNRPGVNRAGIAYRSGWGGNRVGWNDNYWNRPGWGVAAAGAAVGLAAGAAAASTANYYGDALYDGGVFTPGWSARANDVRYYPSRAVMTGGGYIPMNYIGPICNPRVDANCQ